METTPSLAPAAPASARPVWIGAAVVTLVLAAAASLGVDAMTQRWAADAAQRQWELERARAQTLAVAISAGLQQRLALARGVALSFTQGAEVRAVLSQRAAGVAATHPALAQRLSRLDERLDIAVRELGLGLIAVADLHGEVVAAGEPPSIPSFVGKQYSEGPLYAQARQGRSVRMFLVGETTGRRSVVFAEPVMVQDRFVGYVGVSLTLDESLLPVQASDAFVTDQHGVVVLSHDWQRLFRRLVHEPSWSPPPANGWPIYGGQPPRLWPWYPGPHPGLWWLEAPGEGVPVVEARTDIFEGLLHTHVLQPAHWFADLEQQRRRLRILGTSLAVAVLGSFVLLLGTWWQGRRHRQALEALNRELQRIAVTDALTGIANRRSILQQLDDELRRLRRHGRPLSVLSLDLDYFKQVNDRYGHAVGDAMLQHVVRTVQQQLRATDSFGRIGGEEFLVLLPETGAEEAQKVAFKLREAVARSPLTVHEGTPLAMTVSIGGLTATEAEWDAARLLALADAALYEAKRAGRDCVRWAAPPATPTCPTAG
ncbi:MAG: diguanylate cyclase [Tepidimonas sp.]|nr:diguanylate cyclase [Tepidimonas sp.]